MDRDTFLDLIPAYALGALDADEQAEFETHLATDDEAQKLLAEYQALTDSMILLVPTRSAPAHLQADLRRRIAASPNLPADPEVPPPVQRRPTPVIYRWLAAAAVLVVLLGATFLVSQLMVETPATPTPFVSEARLLFDTLQSNTEAIQFAVSGGEDFAEVNGELLVNPADNSAVMYIRNLPERAEDQIFQLWAVDNEGESRSISLFAGPDEHDYSGEAYILVPLDMDLDNYRGFWGFLEPSGGSPFPDRRSGPGFRIRLAET